MEMRGWAMPDKYNLSEKWIVSLATKGWLGVVMFLLLALSLFDLLGAIHLAMQRSGPRITSEWLTFREISQFGCGVVLPRSV